MTQKHSDLGISVTEWQAEMDRLRVNKSGHKAFTETDMKIIHYARTSGDIPVSWRRLAEWWREHKEQKTVNQTTLIRKYNQWMEKREKESIVHP